MRGPATAVACALIVATLAPVAAFALSLPALSGGIRTGTPTAMQVGRTTGVGAGARWHRGPIFYGARLGTGWTTESSLAWEVRHFELRGALVVGAERALGRGRLFAAVAAGATALWENGDRHQSARLGDDAGALTSEAMAIYPRLGLDLGVSLTVGAGWGARLRLGPTLHWRGGAGSTLGWVGAVEVERRP